MAPIAPNLYPASYKGVAFAVTTASDTGGRATVKHIFPQKERGQTYVEDLGAAENTFTLEAFVLGPDYQNKAASLLNVLRQAGPGSLVHPWLGELYVSQSAPFKRNYTYQHLGWVGFTLTFTEDAAPDNPTASAFLPGQVDSLADSAGLLSGDYLDEACRLSGVADQVLSDTLSACQRVATTVNDILNGNWSQVAMLAGRITGVDVSGFISLVRRAGSLSGLLGGLFGFGESAQTSPLTASQYNQFFALSASPIAALPAKAGITRTQSVANQQALESWLGRMGAVESLRGTANLTPRNQEQASQLQQEIVESAARLQNGLIQPAAPDALAGLVRDLSALSLNALAANSGAAPRLVMQKKKSFSVSTMHGGSRCTKKELSEMSQCRSTT